MPRIAAASPEPLILAGPARHPWVMDDEEGALVTSLLAQREHVIGALEGLSDAQLRRPALIRLTRRLS